MNETERRLLAAIDEAGRTRAELQRLAGLDQVSVQMVQRALRSLVARGVVATIGVTRDRKYRRGAAPVAEPPSGAEAPDEVPLSPGARECLSLLARPLTARTPVSYERAFLDAYVPGRSWWLDAPTRQRLAALGKTPALTQPAGTWARRVLERFLLDLSWNSSRLEGNTYSLLDTERLLARGEAAEGKDLRETQMLLNHKAAIEYLVAEPMTAAVDARTVKTLNAVLMENLLATRLDEGRLRSTPVAIGSSVYVPLANPQLIDECFRQLVLTAAAIEDPFEASLFLLAQVPYLQPFLDGNKRTARLAANLPFVIGNRTPLSFADVPRDLLLKGHLAVYELRRVDLLRDVFLWAYERSAARLGAVRQSVGEPDQLRLRFRELLHEVVHEVVRANPPPRSVGRALAAFAARRVAREDRPRFIAMAELELESLHDGNFGRYRLRPSEYEAWARKRTEAVRR